MAPDPTQPQPARPSGKRPPGGVTGASERPVVTGPVLGPASKRQLSRYLAVILVVMAAEGALALGAVILVNPRNEFPVHVFTPLIPNEYLQKLEKFDQHPPVDTLIFGTSRMRRINTTDAAAAGWGSAFNFAVGGAEINDELALYRAVVARDRAPKHIVVGVDLAQFRPDIVPTLRVITSKELQPYAEQRAGPWDYLQWAVFMARDRGYFVDMAKVIQYTLTEYPPVTERVGVHGDTISVGGPLPLVNTTIGQFRLRESVLRYGDQVNSFETPHAEPVALLRLFVEEARRQGTDVHLILPPHHEDLVRWLDEQGPTFRILHRNVRDAVAAMCGPGVHLHDFNEVANFGGDPNGFTDAIHIGGPMPRQILQAARDGRMDVCGGA